MQNIHASSLLVVVFAVCSSAYADAIDTRKLNSKVLLLLFFYVGFMCLPFTSVVNKFVFVFFLESHCRVLHQLPLLIIL